MAGHRRGLGVMVALAGLGMLALASPILLDRVLLHEISVPQSEAQPQPEIEAEKSAVPDEGQAAAPSSPAPLLIIARPVAPETIAPPEIKQHELERIDPRQPLGPIGSAHVPSQGPVKETVLHRPLVTGAGAFEAMGYRIMLPGLIATAATKICGEGDAAWPCGIHARTAFRNWLRGRALACVVPPAPPPEQVVTPCSLGKIDAGAWLVEQGWALADPADDRYAGLGVEARSAGRGLYGAGPSALVPFNVTLPPAADQGLPPAEALSD